MSDDSQLVVFKNIEGILFVAYTKEQINSSVEIGYKLIPYVDPQSVLGRSAEQSVMPTEHPNMFGSIEAR